jgi:probable phosphoglycerate mutase
MSSSGHFLRVFATRWLGLQPAAGRYWLLAPASLSAIGNEHDTGEAVIWVWNETYERTDCANA